MSKTITTLQPITNYPKIPTSYAPKSVGEQLVYDVVADPQTELEHIFTACHDNRNDLTEIGRVVFAMFIKYERERDTEQDDSTYDYALDAEELAHERYQNKLAFLAHNK